MLLHVFPEFWYSWHRYIRPLIDAGYRVLVPDQLGYNRSGKPAGVRPYLIMELTHDVVALIRSDGYESAHVIGHDWGAFVAWNLALREPDRIDRLGMINVPHPTAFQRMLFGNREQPRRDWYAFAFQIPLLPE